MNIEEFMRNICNADEFMRNICNTDEFKMASGCCLVEMEAPVLVEAEEEMREEAGYAGKGCSPCHHRDVERRWRRRGLRSRRSHWHMHNVRLSLTLRSRKPCRSLPFSH